MAGLLPRRGCESDDPILGVSDLLERFREATSGLSGSHPPAGIPLPARPAPETPTRTDTAPFASTGGRIATDAARLRAGICSSEELLDEALALLDRWEPTILAVTLDLRDRARGQARQADRELRSGLERGPLHGIPIAVKDLLDIAGHRTSAGSRLTEGHRAMRSAQTVDALEAAGAVLVAKANTHEYAFGALTPPTRNPRDPRCMPGGSSGGSAALVGAGVFGAAVGTDTAGSVREPAALCGAVGLKPTTGRVSNEGVVPLSWSLDTVGPIGACVADAAYLLGGLGIAPSYRDSDPTPRTLSGLRVAIWDAAFHRLQAPVRDGLERGLSRLVDAGATLTSVSPGEPDELVAAALVLLGAEALAFHASFLPSRRNDYRPDVIAYLDLSATFTSTDLVNAQRIRRRFKESVDQIFSTHDLFLSPAQIVLPPRVDDVDVVFEDGRRAPRDLSLIRTLAPFNLSGHPALSLPVAVDGSTGHTVSLQLVAEHDRDWWLLGIGALLEDAVGAMPAPVAP